MAGHRSHFRRASAWIENGEIVKIVNRCWLFERLVLPIPAKEAVPKADWADQRKAIWGDRVFSAKEVQEMDDFEHEGGRKDCTLRRRFT